jgi:hypothetical protein
MLNEVLEIFGLRVRQETDVRQNFADLQSSFPVRDIIMSKPLELSCLTRSLRET